LSFVRNADVVKMACLAQIVNVIAPIMTRKDGILIQPNYYPLQLMAAHAVGRSLRPLLTCPTYRAGDRGDVPALDVAATLDGSGGLAVFAVNRSGAEDVELTLSVDDAVITEVRGVDVLSGTDPKAVNDWEHPRRVVPQAGNARLAEGKAALKVPRYGFVALRAATRHR
jgi:alpha-N-arabinofuranosidase